MSTAQSMTRERSLELSSESDESFSHLMKLQLACLCKIFKKYKIIQQPFENFITLKIDVKLNERQSSLDILYQTNNKTHEVQMYLSTPPNIPVTKVTIDDLKSYSAHELEGVGCTAGMHIFLHERPHVNCIIHLNTSYTASVSAMKCGLKNISQASAMLGPICYYNESCFEASLMSKVFDSTKHRVIVLKNNGILCVGDSIHEAFHFAIYCQEACKTQIMCLAQINELHEISRNSYFYDENSEFEEFEYHFSCYLKKLLAQGELLKYATSFYNESENELEYNNHKHNKFNEIVPKSESDREVKVFNEYKSAFGKIEAYSLINDLKKSQSSIDYLNRITSSGRNNVAMTSGVLKAIVKRRVRNRIDNI